jgi:hypothetical protein
MSDLNVNKTRWPVLQCRAVMTDQDVEFASDMAYLRALLDDVEDAHVDLQCRINFAPTGVELGQFRLLQDAAERLPFMPVHAPWPEDRAAELLACWRAEIDGEAAA